MSDIKAITEPSIYLVGRQSIDQAELDRFLSDEGVESWTTDTDVAGQILNEVAGRLCYKSYAKPRPGGNAAYLRHLLEVGHGSVLEGAVFNFVVTGVSRSLTHELIRARAGMSYSQRSQRFCDESELAVVVPPALTSEVDAAAVWLRDGRWADDAEDGLEVIANSGRRDIELMGVDDAIRAGLLWLASMERSRRAYSSLADYLALKVLNRHYPQDNVTTVEGAKAWLDLAKKRGSGDIVTSFRKQAREAARSVLPNAAETQIAVTANARALRNLIEQRGAKEADAEIARLAVAILRILQVEAPNLFGDYEIRDEGGGRESVYTPWRKV